MAKQLKLDATILQARLRSDLPDLSTVNFNHDVVFTWNGTTSGVRVPDGDWIAQDRAGLTICDATSAAFAMELPWDRLDVTTFSWQKVLGGEAAHGMIVLSPRAVERLESYTPPGRLPKIFRLTKGGKLIEAIFRGETSIRPRCWRSKTIWSLDWARSVGGLTGLIARADANAQAVRAFVATTGSKILPRSSDTLDHLGLPEVHRPADFRRRCLCQGGGKAAGSRGRRLDIGGYRDAPPGLRIWCGGTVETADIAAMLPWLDWAFEPKCSQAEAA